MSYLNLGSYNDEVQNIASQYNSNLTKADTAFETKNKANEITKTLGEAKTFISGKKVTEYLYKKGTVAIKDAVEKAGVKLNEVRGNFQLQGIGSMRTLQDQIGNAINQPDVYSKPIDGVVQTARSEIEGTASREVGVIANPTYSSVKPNVLENEDEGETLLDEAQARLLSGISKEALGQSRFLMQPKVTDSILSKGGSVIQGEAEGGALEQSVGGALGRIASQNFPNPLAVIGKVKSVVKSGIKDASEEAGDAILDILPGADIVGALLGIGLTAGAIAHKPKEQNPIDSVNPSFQIGI